MKKFIKENWHYILALIIPVLLMMIHAFRYKLWFFGNGSILVGDSMVQILPVYYELWNKVHSGASLSYTWNIGGGLDFYSLLGYVASPFTIIMLCVPKSMLEMALESIIVCKWALSSLTVTFFFYNTKFNELKERKKIVSLFLGLAFSLSNGLINYMGYPQLMDAVICFPILLLLLEKMFEQKKWKLYYIVLSFSMLTSIYTSYITCLFLCIWFIFIYNKEYKKDFGKIFIRFAGGSVLAAMTAIAAISQLLNSGTGRLTQDGVSEERWGFAKMILVKPSEFLQQLFVFVPMEKASSLLPNMYLSVVGISLIPFLVFIKINKKIKIKLMILEALMVISIIFGAVSLVWHGFTVPNGVYHREIYVVVFAILFGLLYVIQNLRDIDYKKIFIVGIVDIGLFVYAFVKVEVYRYFFPYYMTALILLCALIILVLFCKKSIGYKQVIILISVLGIVELSLNALNMLKYYVSTSYTYIDRYGTEKLYNDEMNMKPGERMVSLYAYNFGMVFDRPSGEGFISSINQNNLYLHDELGLGVSGHVEYSEVGGSPFINLFYNNAYGISYHENTFSDVTEVDSQNGTTLYKMNRLAGLGYMVNSDVSKWDVESTDCFDAQNQFVDLAVGGKDFFNRLEVDLSAQDANGNGLMYTKTKGLEYCVYYTPQYASIYDSIQAEFTVDHDMDLYVYMIGDYNVNDYFYYYIYVDGEQVEEDTRACSAETIHIGKVKKGQKVSMVRIPVLNTSLNEETSWGIVFDEFDEEAYNESYEKLSKNTYDISVFEDDYVKGTIHADEDGIMMTSILADDNFTVYVDGDKVSYETIGDTMIGVPLSKGDHTVEFKYKNDALKKGLVGSGVGFLLFVLVCIIEKIVAKHKKTEDDEDTDEYTESDEVMLENPENIQEDEVTQETKTDMEKVQEEDHPEELEEEIQE